MVDGNIILSVAKAMELLQLLSRSKKPLSLKGAVGAVRLSEEYRVRPSDHHADL